ncbi:uncharacterized protein BDV14DRAFT_170675, partial [Aspergillus stella-maris]|uniref:uncharacterized protein n=1 Tax=Aspergillus stella-maris TaxID=1810926 RepID=UPI003CCE39C7
MGCTCCRNSKVGTLYRGRDGYLVSRICIVAHLLLYHYSFIYSILALPQSCLQQSTSHIETV